MSGPVGSVGSIGPAAERILQMRREILERNEGLRGLGGAAAQVEALSGVTAPGSQPSFGGALTDALSRVNGAQNTVRGRAPKPRSASRARNARATPSAENPRTPHCVFQTKTEDCGASLGCRDDRTAVELAVFAPENIAKKDRA